MKLAIISDTHGMHEQVELPDADVLIHCGDFTARDTRQELEQFARWHGSHSHEHKLILCGNHDSSDISYESYKEIFSEYGVTYMQDETVEIDGTRIYAMPWTPTFYNWYWMKDRGPKMREMTDKIPLDTNVLITHGPQFGVMDETEEGLNVGCEQLRRRMIMLSELQVHCFGHIHEAYGRELVVNEFNLMESHVDHGGYESINASIVNRQYKPVNKPVVAEL